MDEPTNAEAEQQTPNKNGITPKERRDAALAFFWLALPVIANSAFWMYWPSSSHFSMVAMLIGLLIGVFFCALGWFVTGADRDYTGLVVGGWFGLILTVIFLPVFAQSLAKAQQISCLNNVRALTTALRQYAADNEDALPSAGIWSDAIGPYMVAERKIPMGKLSVYQCPSAKSAFGYAFADGLSSAELKKVKEPGNSPLIYDSAAATRNAHDALTSLPKPGRHLKGNIIGYADGHARRVKDGDMP